MAAVDPRTPTMTTALEVVKGALAAVIGFPIGKSTIGSRISEGNKARITVVSTKTAGYANHTLCGFVCLER